MPWSKFPLINSTVQLEQGRKTVSMGNKLKGIIVCQVEMMTAALEWRRDYTSHWLGVKSKRGSKKTLRLEVGWLPKRWSSLTTWGDTMTRMEASWRQGLKGLAGHSRGTAHRPLEGSSAASGDTEARAVGLGEVMKVNYVTKGENNIWKSILKKFLDKKTSTFRPKPENRGSRERSWC